MQPFRSSSLRTHPIERPAAAVRAGFALAAALQHRRGRQSEQPRHEARHVRQHTTTAQLDSNLGLAPLSKGPASPGCPTYQTPLRIKAETRQAIERGAQHLCIAPHCEGQAHAQVSTSSGAAWQPAQPGAPLLMTFCRPHSSRQKKMGMLMATMFCTHARRCCTPFLRSSALACGAGRGSGGEGVWYRCSWRFQRFRGSSTGGHWKRCCSHEALRRDRPCRCPSNSSHAPRSPACGRSSAGAARSAPAPRAPVASRSPCPLQAWPAPGGREEAM